MVSFVQKQTTLLVVILIGCCQFEAFGQKLATATQPYTNQSVQVSFQEDQGQQLLEQALKEIGTQHKISFAFDQKVVDQKKVRKSALKANDLDQLLRNILTPLGLTYKKLDATHYIIRVATPKKQSVGKVETRTVSATAKQASLLPLSDARSVEQLPSLEKTISGQVTDENGESLPGVNILVKNTTVGTVTDIDGNFRVTAPDNAETLVFSSVGYLTQEVAINNRTTINLTMSPNVESLSEVVVVGYGTQKKSDVTGSVVSVDSEILQEANKVNAVQAIQGQVPGLDIQTVSNKPGGGFNIRVRGANTINFEEPVSQGGYSPGQNPLFVVDGIFVDDISFINPADIEQIDVLKDASATAIYGARGSSGVVIVTTKRGKSGKLSVQYDNYFGVRQPYNLPDIFEGEEYVEFMRDAVVGLAYSSGDFSVSREDVDLSTFLRPNELENIANGEYVDWVDLIKQNGFQMNHTLSLSGGTDRTTYGFGAGYTVDEGTFPGESLERYNIRANVQGEISDKITLTYSGYATYQVLNNGSFEGFRSAYRLRPTGTAFDENGEPEFWPLEGETFITNPLFEEDNITREHRSLSYIGNLGITVKPIEGLSLTSTFSPNLRFNRYGEYRGLFSKSVGQRVDNRRAIYNNSNNLGYTWDNIINYEVSLGAEHQLNATLISSAWTQRDELIETQVRNFTTDEFLFYNIDAGSDIRGLQNSFVQQSILSYSARLNYSLLSRYLLTVTGRYDGSSMLSEQNKWAFFPSAALAWRVSDEAFMENQSFVSDLKLRFSYGETGNNGAGGGLNPLGSQALINAGFTNLGDQPVQSAFFGTRIANQDLTWERTSEFNLGIDYGFLENRLVGALELYNRHTTDLILSRSLPTFTGKDQIFDNVGEIRNRGIEFNIRSVNVDNGSFKWTTLLNFARNINRIEQLYGGLDRLPNFSTRDAELIHQIGEDVGSFFTFEPTGIWQLDEADEAQALGQQPGQVKVRDVNEDGIITAEDRTIVGSPQPDWTGSITNTINFKGFDFTVFAYTRQGVESYSWFHRSHGWDQDDAPARFNGWATQYWTPDNPTNTWHQPGNSGPYKRALFYRDVSFVKIGYMTLGYTLPRGLVDRLGLSSLRVYATAQNPFVFTDYEGWDPESAGRNSWGAAFLSRTLMAGVNVRF
ncbi:SusC/RagA family TonB-linked outer membrane protein [Tunicatimonas pelagia]|uniref:SusC/RagA family TonB-linked outer membrane protein n=1 Tax=Tunicatimonas pelagia TaxID=931531 RepID=UPI0026651504|nr:TonB-dependent receptor [Tunicatimonas pelagia]WKN42623.1 TonB-dependent receptor [Tunicatimonas pelagia]